MENNSIELDFTTLNFYPNYVISRVREDVLVGANEVRELITACADFYKKSKFVYISLRENDYNVDPTIYVTINKLNLAGIAIVSKKAPSLNMAEFEKKFLKIPFEIFNELEEAKSWANKLIK